MKNSLLIHHNNVVSQNNFNKRIQFNLTNEDDNLDSYITKDIIPKIKAVRPNIIYIKDNLSSQYLELYGLKLAYHIRLSLELQELRFIPIIIISDVDTYVLNKLTHTAKILFTKNIFITQNDNKSMENFSQLKLKNLTENEYKNEFLNRIEIYPPQESSHDISNEWAIYQYAEFLKIKNDKAINENREKIASMLYFKYLLAQNPTPQKSGISFAPRTPKLGGRILYIDDEWNKGWGTIFQHYFSRNSNTVFDVFDYNFQDVNKFTIISDIKKRCLKNEPDLVILDLRLAQTDHDNDNIDSFTGIKIANMIKEINPAIQILMFTATSKSLILEKLYDYDILGYIKKEHPEDKTITVKESFEKLAMFTDKGFEKKYLKEIWKIEQSITINNPQIQLEIKSIFEILNSNIDNRFIYAMFAIFKSIEIINDYFFIDSYKKAIWKDTKKELSDNSTKNKIITIIKERSSINNLKIERQVEEIVNVRNKTIHPKNGNISKIDKDEILEWFKMLKIIIEKIRFS